MLEATIPHHPIPGFPGLASADLKPPTPWARSRFPGAYKIEMDRSKNTGFADRLSAAADAKKAQLERAARARSEAESPAAVERRRARPVCLRGGGEPSRSRARRWVPVEMSAEDANCLIRAGW